MKKLVNKSNVNAADGTWPFGDVRDKTPSLAGTRWDKEMMSDALQFFEKMFSESGETANGLPDNQTNGFQLYTAFRKLTKPYNSYTALVTQSGTSAPTAKVLGYNTIGSIVWSRTSTGIYRATLTGAFTVDKVFVLTTVNETATDPSKILWNRITTNYVEFRVFDSTETLSDNKMQDASIEIRIYD